MGTDTLFGGTINVTELEAQLRDYEAKVAALKGVISAIRSAQAAGVLATKPSAPVPLPPKPYQGMTVANAIRRFFSQAQIKGYKASEIASALLKGGFQTQSEKFGNVVTGTLRRMAEQGKGPDDVFHYSVGWGLNKWASKPKPVEPPKPPAAQPQTASATTTSTDNSKPAA